MMKNRRSFVLKSLTAISGLTLIHASVNATQKSNKIPGNFLHAVYFWLKPETNVDEFIRGTEKFLKQVPAVVSYHLGKPAMTPREVVDNSYSVSLVVTFEDAAGQDAYQVHPAHLSYVEENSTKWTQVKIFDSIG